MSQQEPKKDIRSMMQPVGGSDRYHLGEPLITVDPKNLHARTKLTSIFTMSVHSTLTKFLGKDKLVKNNQNVVFDMSTLGGVMDYWQFEYEAMAPSLDGGAREQYVKVSQLAAIGGSDDSGQLATSVLNEGSKNLSGKDNKKK